MTITRIQAKQILHDLEIELDAKVGSIEHNENLVDCVVGTINALDSPNECHCNCVACMKANHEDVE